MDIRKIDSYSGYNIQKIREDVIKTKEKDNKQEIKKNNFISGESKKYIDLASKIPEVRSKTVLELKDAIDKGIYQYDVKNIAEKMLGDN